MKAEIKLAPQDWNYPGQLLNLDVCGMFSIPDMNGNIYSQTYLDAYCRFDYHLTVKIFMKKSKTMLNL